MRIGWYCTKMQGPSMFYFFNWELCVNVPQDINCINKCRGRKARYVTWMGSVRAFVEPQGQIVEKNIGRKRSEFRDNEEARGESGLSRLDRGVDRAINQRLWIIQSHRLSRLLLQKWKNTRWGSYKDRLQQGVEVRDNHRNSGWSEQSKCLWPKALHVTLSETSVNPFKITFFSQEIRDEDCTRVCGIMI